ncbi:MAG: hypothetical protein RRZ69_05090, partial [Clostridia bacterium]
IECRIINRENTINENISNSKCFVEKLIDNKLLIYELRKCLKICVFCGKIDWRIINRGNTINENISKKGKSVSKERQKQAKNTQ